MKQVFWSAILAAWSSIAAAQTFDVAPELWDRPRTGAAVAQDENVKRAVAALLAKKEARLVIHHASGEAPLEQAEELRSWLGALAVDARRITLRAGLAGNAPIRLEVTP